MFFNHKRSTGFQLSGDVLRAVCLSRSGRTVQVAGTVSVELRDRVDPVSMGGEAGCAVVTDALEEALDALHGNVGAVCVGLPHGAFFLKERPLLHPRPRGRRQQRENREHLAWETRVYLDEAYQHYAVDMVPVHEQAFVVAVRHAVLDLYNQLFDASQLPEPEFDIEPFALHNIAEAAGLTAAEHTVALIGVGVSGAHLMLERAGRLVHVIHCEAKDDNPDTLTERLVRRVDDSVADGKTEAPEAFWVAGDKPGKICEQLQDRLACPCAPVPWQRATDADDQAAPDAHLAVAAGLAFRRLNG